MHKKIKRYYLMVSNKLSSEKRGLCLEEKYKTINQ